MPDPLHPHVFAFARPHPLGRLPALHNFTEEQRFVSLELPRSQGIRRPLDRISGKEPETSGNDLRLAPYGVLWSTEA